MIISGHVGRLLPNQVPNVTEILPLWGLRLGFPMDGGGTFEVGNISGNGEGAKWNSIYMSLRGDMQIEDLTGIVYFGADAYRYEGTNQEVTTVGGGHLGGGVLSSVGQFVKLRIDMKFNINPGTSLYFGIGFMFGGATSGGGPGGR